MRDNVHENSSHLTSYSKPHLMWLNWPQWPELTSPTEYYVHDMRSHTRPEVGAAATAAALQSPTASQ